MALIIAAPLIYGVVTLTQRLGLTLAVSALPTTESGRVNLAATPRRALVVTLQLAIVLLVGLPLAALSQPFLPGWVEALALAIVLVILGVVFWRSAMNLQGHVKAGAELIVEALAAQSKEDVRPSGEDALARIQHLMPGLGAPVSLKLPSESPAVGKTLADLDLRGRTGASVLAIARGKESVIVPTASEVLKAGDVLAMAGTRDAVAAATEMLIPAPAGVADSSGLS